MALTSSSAALNLLLSLLTLLMHAAEPVAQSPTLSSTKPEDPWGRTPHILASKWGDERGTIQHFDAVRTVLELHAIDEYMTSTIHADGSDGSFYAPVWDACHLGFEYCAEMSADSRCTDPDTMVFMNKKCAPACRTCHLLSRDTQCRYRENATELDAIQPGDLNRLFEHMITDASLGRFGPRTIYSMPGGSPVGGPRSNDGVILDGPWVLTFENFLTPEECARLIHYGATVGSGWSTSKVKEHAIDPTYNATKSRSSSTNWCNYECLTDPIIRGIQRRLEDLTDHAFPEDNFEYLQILKYEVGQHYDHHNDYHSLHIGRAHGPRVLTVFFFLNDVEGGGGTNFNKLGGDVGDGGADKDAGLTIEPQMGKALIWPSVLDDQPNVVDVRTMHGALPVVRGRKFGANAWIHQRPYRTVKRDCKF